MVVEKTVYGKLFHVCEGWCESSLLRAPRSCGQQRVYSYIVCLQTYSPLRHPSLWPGRLTSLESITWAPLLCGFQVAQPLGDASRRLEGRSGRSLTLPTWPCVWPWSCPPVTTAPPERYLSHSSSSQPALSYTILPMPTLSGLGCYWFSFVASPVILVLVPWFPWTLLWPLEVASLLGSFFENSFARLWCSADELFVKHYIL